MGATCRGIGLKHGLIRSVGTVLLALLWSFTTCASSSQVNISAENIAVSGYDLVSYFASQPEQGSEDFASQHQGVTYLFSSPAHVEQFEANPEHFLPAYGGYCAYGVSMGKRLSIDPGSYEIVAGRLYLLLNRVTKKIWQNDRQNNISKANRLWHAAQLIP